MIKMRQKKTIKITPETHRQLKILQANNDCESLDTTIEFLLQNQR
jgi:hypothetical protein